ncbi:unnamed protein product [Somion occarium]|uniref:F-box domain-containing protein n=1 Tax=Somion occarium TaxID=3059160 RepID=A0ABP1DDI7_9APHY
MDPPSLQPRLPLELLMIVKESIPISDLRTHVCFYNTCRAFASWYGSTGEQADFWRRSCLLAGLTFTGRDSSYKDIAFECISQDGFCSHPSCGGSQLEWNAKQVAIAMQCKGGWDPEEAPWHSATWDNESGFPTPKPNRIFAHLAFRKSRRTGSNKLDDVFLRNDAANIPYDKRALRYHPIAWRSIATFPGLVAMKLSYPGEAGRVINEATDYVSMKAKTTPLNVLSVVDSIRRGLDDGLEVSQLCELLDGCFACVQPPTPVVFVDELKKFQTLRGLWAVSRWDGLEFDGTWEFPEEAGFIHRFSRLREDTFAREQQEEDILDHGDFS